MSGWRVVQEPELQKVDMTYQATGEESIRDQIVDVGKAVAAVASDPHLSEVTCHVLRLKEIQEGRPDPGICKPVSIDYLPDSGIGLRYAVVPLRYYVAARKHPFIAGLVVIGSAIAITATFYALVDAVAGRK